MFLHRLARKASSASVIVLVALTVRAAHGGIPGISQRFDDRVIVHLHPGASVDQYIATVEADHPGVFLDVLDSIGSRNMHLLELEAPDGTDLDLLEDQLEDDYPALVESAEFLYETAAPEGHTGTVFVDGPVTASMYRDQYAVSLLDLDGAHRLSTGGGVVVAVLDTGVDATHPELAGRVLPGYNVFTDGADTADVGDDLDSVAGLVTLAAPDAWILPVRVLDADGVGDGWALTKGMYHAIDRGVEVINLSLGTTYLADTVETAIEEAALLGIVPVGGDIFDIAWRANRKNVALLREYLEGRLPQAWDGGQPPRSPKM